MTSSLDTIIVGGGLSGLTVAHKLRTSCYGHRFLLLEKSESVGGVIRSHRKNGFIAENGPHGFLDNCKESRELLAECGLEKECIKSPLSNFVRYVLRNGSLQMIPQTPKKILFAPLISWREKFRVLAELWQSPLAGEPTVAKWVEHRFGPSLLPYADAVFTGTYAGDIEKLTIDSVMPGLRELEKNHGSILRGLVKKITGPKKNKATTTNKKFRMPAMTSFPDGMERLPHRLSEFLQKDKDLLLNCGVEKISHEQGHWQIKSTQGEFKAPNLVLALPVNNALALLKTTYAPPLTEISEANIATVVFGFGPGSSLPPGFGYLSPEEENRFSLGTLFSSNMFPGRAPAGHILFETLVGGRRHPERLELSDEGLISRALEDVREVLSLQKDPIYTEVLRPWGGIPQLEKDYPKLLSWRNSLCKENENLHICGFGWDGIGLNDMVKHATLTANDIIKGVKLTSNGPEVKGVYF